MKARNRSRFIVCWFAAVAALALGIVGIAYSGWVDTVVVAGKADTAVVGTLFRFSDNNTAKDANMMGHTETTDGISDNVAAQNSAGVLLHSEAGKTRMLFTIASANVTLQYHSDFWVQNTGSIPVRVLVGPLPLAGFSAQLRNTTGDGVIDPGETEGRRLEVQIYDQLLAGQTLTIDVSAVPWNE